MRFCIPALLEHAILDDKLQYIFQPREFLLVELEVMRPSRGKKKLISNFLTVFFSKLSIKRH